MASEKEANCEFRHLTLRYVNLEDRFRLTTVRRLLIIKFRVIQPTIKHSNIKIYYFFILKNFFFFYFLKKTLLKNFKKIKKKSFFIINKKNLFRFEFPINSNFRILNLKKKKIFFFLIFEIYFANKNAKLSNKNFQINKNFQVKLFNTNK